MFSNDSYVNFAIIAKRKAREYGVILEIDWENSVLDFQGKCTEKQWEDLICEISDLAKLYDLEEMF